MGCDIHGFAQWRGYDGRYANVSRIPWHRNYTLFALLADVRNTDGIMPFSEPRGLPDGLCLGEYAAGDPNRYFTDVGDHSHTYMSLAELRNWDGWNQIVQRRRLLDRVEYERIQTTGGDQPRTYSGGAFGQAVISVEQSAVEDGTAPPDWNHVWYTWKLLARDDCGHFLEWLDWLHEEYCYGDDPGRDVRIIMGFDS